MTPEELQRFNKLERDFNQLQDLFYRARLVDKYLFDNVLINGTLTLKKALTLTNGLTVTGGLTLTDGSTLTIGSTTGGKIGATGDKVGFLGATPVVRQAAITAPTGGATIDAEARTAINTIITVLQTFGLTS